MPSKTTAMFYAELSVQHPLDAFVGTARVYGASVKTLMSEPSWKTTTVRLFGPSTASVVAVLQAHFPPATAQMHAAAIKPGVC